MQRAITPAKACGIDPTPAPFFAGVMAMGVFSVVGLALYGRFISPVKEQRQEVETT